MYLDIYDHNNRVDQKSWRVRKKNTVASKTFYKIPQNIVPKAFQQLVKKFGSQF